MTPKNKSNNLYIFSFHLVRVISVNTEALTSHEPEQVSPDSEQLHYKGIINQS